MKPRILKIKAWLNLVEPDYDGFVGHIKAWEAAGVPFGAKQLEEISEKYGTPIPYLNRGEVNFDVDVKHFIKK